MISTARNGRGDIPPEAIKYPPLKTVLSGLNPATMAALFLLFEEAAQDEVVSAVQQAATVYKQRRDRAARSHRAAHAHAIRRAAKASNGEAK